VLLLVAIRPKIQTFTYFIALDSAKLLSQSSLSHSKESSNALAKSVDMCRHLRDSLGQVVRALPALDDAMPLGYYVRHTFRYKNSRGSRCLDSIDFYVDRRGKVEMAG
jgi:hypothetical protein